MSKRAWSVPCVQCKCMMPARVCVRMSLADAPIPLARPLDSVSPPSLLLVSSTNSSAWPKGTPVHVFDQLCIRVHEGQACRSPLFALCCVDNAELHEQALQTSGHSGSSSCTDMPLQNVSCPVMHYEKLLLEHEVKHNWPECCLMGQAYVGCVRFWVLQP